MRKIYVITICLLFPVLMFAQYSDLKLSVTNMGDTIIMDRYGNKATVKSMSVFGERIVENSKGDKITIKKGAIGDITISSNKGVKVILRENVMGDRTAKDGYGSEAVVVIDQSGSVAITDSKGGEIFIGAGLYGNLQEIEKFAFFEERRPNDSWHDNDYDVRDIYSAIRENRRGEFEYSNRRNKATLRRDSFDKMIYEDSNGNDLKFSRVTWSKMLRRERDERRVFASLINLYL